jgi:transposase
MPPTIMDREFIDLWTRIPRFIGRLCTSASSHHDLSLAAFITNIAGSDFRYTQLWHDGQGMCLFAKRLERGRFVWPSTVAREGADRTVTITPAQLGYLLEGIDWRLPQHTWRPQAAG